MTNNAIMNGLDMNEIFGERIETALVGVGKKLLNSDNIELRVEHGSKKGMELKNWVG